MILLKINQSTLAVIVCIKTIRVSQQKSIRNVMTYLCLVFKGFPLFLLFAKLPHYNTTILYNVTHIIANEAFIYINHIGVDDSIRLPRMIGLTIPPIDPEKRNAEAIVPETGATASCVQVNKVGNIGDMVNPSTPTAIHCSGPMFHLTLTKNRSTERRVDV